MSSMSVAWRIFESMHAAMVCMLPSRTDALLP